MLYGGSASKILAPVMRLGWLVAPVGLVEELGARQALAGGVPSTLSQLALADLIERGELDRHLRRQRRRYRAQRDALLEAAAELLPELQPEGAAAGLHVISACRRVGTPRPWRRRRRARGSRSTGLAEHRTRPAGPALVIGYGRIAEAAIEPGVRALAAAISAAHPPRAAAPPSTR